MEDEDGGPAAAARIARVPCPDRGLRKSNTHDRDQAPQPRRHMQAKGGLVERSICIVVLTVPEMHASPKASIAASPHKNFVRTGRLSVAGGEEE